MTTNPSPPDWRGLCEELVLRWDVDGCDWKPQHQQRWNAAIERARAALAAEADGPAVPEGREPASVVGEPSDEELDVLADEWLDWNLEGHRAFARAALARYGHQPAPPAAGEVGELVAWLRDQATWFTADDPGHENYDRAADLLSIAFATGAEAWEPIPQLPAQHQAAPAPAEGEMAELVAKLRRLAPQNPLGIADPTITRAADLLEQRHPAPVPVAERLPELRGMFERILCVARSSGDRPVGNIELAGRLIKAVVSWAALPLPQGEVE